MNVYLFGFQKKENSTAQPNQQSGDLVSVQLKENTSVTNPVLILNLQSAGGSPLNPSLYNYVYIPSFMRYYYISNWVYLNGVWECSCDVDVLASNKSVIGNMSTYILRSAYAYNGEIADRMYPTHTDISVSTSAIASNLVLSGVYCVGIISNDPNATQGAITYYFLSASQFGNLKNYLMSNTFLADAGLDSLAEISADLVKVIYNPYQYITSCKYFPIAFPAVGSDVPIRFGWWTLPFSGRQMIPGGYVTNIVSNNIPVPAHPQASARGEFLNHAPYTERYIVHPIFGTILLDANKMEPGDVVSINMSIDGITGEAFFTVLNSTQNIPLYQNSLQIAVDIPIAQMNQDVIGMTRTAITSVGNIISAASRLDVGGVISSTASGILDTLEASIPILQSSPAAANTSMYGIAIQCVNVFRQLVDEDLADRGRPLCEIRTISTIPGYIMCAEGHFSSGAAYDNEIARVNGYLTGGFYYE